MNEYQKKKNCELRMTGLGYRAIANEVELSRVVVRNFCKNNGMNGYLANADENIRKTVIDKALCLNCRTSNNTNFFITITVFILLSHKNACCDIKLCSQFVCLFKNRKCMLKNA